MKHLVARSAAALVALALCVACTNEPVRGTGPTGSGTPSTFPPDVAAMREHEVPDPRNLPDDLCGLLTTSEVSAAVGAPARDGVVTTPGTCAWALSEGADGRPDSGLLVQAPPVVAWVGDAAELDDRPAKRQGGPGVCRLKVLVHTATGEPDDRPALAVTLVVKGSEAEVCPAADDLARRVLDRLPPA